MIDLEDAVVPARKSLERNNLAVWLALQDWPDHSELIVRINDVSTAWWQSDLVSVLCSCLAADIAAGGYDG